MGIDNERTGLVNEIFQLTGQKVEIDDPIVLAALIHSRMIRRAGQDAKKMIQVFHGQSSAGPHRSRETGASGRGRN